MSSDSVGPIIFGDTIAREQLLRGEVISFRSQRRTTGETWARWSRTGEKEADVRVRELTAIHALREDDILEPLDLYWKLSGFRSPDGWRRAIRKHHDTGDGYLYFVTLDPGEIVARLAGGAFPGDQPIEHDIKPSAHKVARVINPARPGEPTDLEPRHVLDVMQASAGRVALHVYDRTDGQHWYRYRPWDDQWETLHVGPGFHDHDVRDRSPRVAMEEWVLTDEMSEVRWVRPSETRHWEWRWCTRLVVDADSEVEAEA